MSRLTYTGQITLVLSRRSRRLLAERLRANKARWVEFSEPQFAIGSGPRAVAMVDFLCNIQKNERGGETSAIEASVVRKLYELAESGDGPGVSVRNVVVWVNLEDEVELPDGDALDVDASES